MARAILFMTSSIAPAEDTYFLKVRDPRTRLDQYKRALEFYIGHLKAGIFDRVVYVDNTAHPLDELRDIASVHGVKDRIEFLSCRSDVEPVFSRFYLELNLMDWAMKHSAFLNGDGDTIVWKVTGRYIIQNIAAIVKSRPDAFDLYVNFRDLPRRALDFYVVAFPRRRYEALFGEDLARYRTTTHGEIIFRNEIESGRFDHLKIVRRLRRTPRLSGIRGYDGAAYGGVKDTAKYLARAAANRVFPWLWI